MNKNNQELDVIVNTPRWLSIKHNRQESEATRAVHSWHDRSTEFHKYCTSNRVSNHSFQRHHCSGCYSHVDCHHRYNCSTESTSVSFRQRQRGFKIRNSQSEYAVSDRNTKPYSYSHETHTNNRMLPEEEEKGDTNLSSSSSTVTWSPRSSCCEGTNCRNFDNLRESSSVTLATSSQSVANKITRCSSQETPGDTVKREDDDQSGSVKGGQQIGELDQELVKEIIRSLRTIGDDLDVRMRRYSEPFSLAEIVAVKSNAGRFLLSSVRHNIVSAAIDASLTILKLINQ